jgi:predicted RND superfamily exporter protein
VLERFPTDELPPGTRARMDGLRAAARQPAITPPDLPPLFTHGVVEKDGRFGRTVLVLQGLGGATWDGRLAVDATRELHAIADSMSPPAHVAGGIVIAALVLETLEREAPRVTALAFLAVAVVVALTFRRVRAWVPVLAALLCSVTWLAAAVIALDQHINFINFIAFPITFGIGVEYAINVLQRHEQSPGDVEAVVRNTGSAVALCSLTTICGYSSLLLAQNRALFSFGVLAVLGELFAIVVAVIALPAALGQGRNDRAFGR